MEPNFLVTGPDGRYVDTRLRFARGDRVRITHGPHAGRRATMESRLGQLSGDHGITTEVGYQVVLDDGRAVQVPWDGAKAM